MAKDNPKQIIETEVEEVFALQKTLEDTEATLMANDQFRKFLELQKTVPQQIDRVWKSIEEQMIVHEIKSIKGDWGSLTIAERLNFNIDYDKLPTKFLKKVPDTRRIADTYRLEGKSPKGTEPYTTKYLTKRLK